MVIFRVHSLLATAYIVGNVSRRWHMALSGGKGVKAEASRDHALWKSLVKSGGPMKVARLAIMGSLTFEIYRVRYNSFRLHRRAVVPFTKVPAQANRA